MKVNGFTPRHNINVLKEEEYLGRAIGYISKYFKNTGNFIPDIQTPIENTMYIYSKLTTTLEPCGQCGTREEITIENKYPIDKRCDATYEWMHLNNPEFPFWKNKKTVQKNNPRLCPCSIKIMMDGFCIGEYCPAKNILMASDWTDTENTITMVSDILEMMCGLDLLKQLKLEKLKPQVTLGTDPEFEVRLGENVISASGLPNYLNFQIGKDGDGNVGNPREIRPRPGRDADELIKNIEELLAYPTGEVWSVAGERYPIGGHMHVAGVGVMESAEFVVLMDHFIGKPMECLNPPTRKDSNYGKLSDARWKKEHGGGEYRTPPAAFLGSKELTRAAFTLTKILAEKHYGGEIIEISDDLITDIVNLGMDRRFALDYLSNIDKLKGSPCKDVRKAWGIKEKVNPKVNFSDQWNPEIMELYGTKITEVLISLERNVEVTLYGVRKDRGEVFAVPPQCTVIPGLDYIPSIKDGIGIPYGVRNSRTRALTHLDSVIEMVKKYTE